MDDTPAYATTRRYARIRAVDYVERYVDVPRMLGYCEQCPIYGKAWSCPPFDFDPLKVWASFEWFEIDAVQIEFADEELAKQRTPTQIQAAVRRAIDREKRLAARAHRRRARPSSRSLAVSAGACELCEPCTRVQGLPCTHPDLMLHSIEALGGDVVASAEELCGLPVAWSDGARMPASVLVVTGLLSSDGPPDDGSGNPDRPRDEIAGTASE